MHKQFEMIVRIHSATKQFKTVSYEQLIVLGQAITKTLKIAHERRLNWVKFLETKPSFVALLYDAAMNNVKGCVENALKLVALNYAPLL